MPGSIKGMSMLVKQGTTVLGGQKGASLEMSASTMDVTAKGVDWKENVAMHKEWKVECDGLYVASDAAYTALQTAFMSGVEVDVNLTNGTIYYGGKAIITSMALEVPYDDAMTYKISLQGTGALATVKPV